VAPGHNPTIASYNARVVKFTTPRVAYCILETKIFSSTFKKRSSLEQCRRCSCKFKRGRIDWLLDLKVAFLNIYFRSADLVSFERYCGKYYCYLSYSDRIRLIFPPISIVLFLFTHLLTPPTYLARSASISISPIYTTVPPIILQYCFGLKTVWIK
jgi:hypothetical protein